MKAAFLPWLLALQAAAVAAQPASLESLAAPLLQARTYCESGKWAASSGASEPLAETTYRVCAHRDGRFKFVQSPGQPQQIVIWSDGRRLHRYVEYGRGYQRYDLAGQEAAAVYGNPREPVPALHSRLFRWATRSAAGLDLLASLRDYQVHGALPGGALTVYERRERDARSGARILVTSASGAILRYESLYDGTVRGYVEVTAREVDAPLADAELRHAVPFFARYSPRNNPPVFLAGLLLGTLLAGVGFWAWFFSRVERLQQAAELRRRLWRLLGWAFVAVAAALALAAAATWGGSGHPPAIVYVMVGAVLAAIGLGLAACFVLSSHAAQALIVRRGTGRD